MFWNERRRYDAWIYEKIPSGEDVRNHFKNINILPVKSFNPPWYYKISLTFHNSNASQNNLYLEWRDMNENISYCNSRRKNLTTWVDRDNCWNLLMWCSAAPQLENPDSDEKHAPFFLLWYANNYYSVLNLSKKCIASVFSWALIRKYKSKSSEEILTNESNSLCYFTLNQISQNRFPLFNKINKDIE